MKRLTLIALFVFAIYSQTTVGQQDEQGAILAPGNPPLTESMVKKSLDLAEWALEMSLSPQERAGVREFFVESWRRGDQNGVIEAAEMYDTISRMPADDKASLRQKLRDLMLQNLQRDPNGRINQIFLAAHNRAKNPATAPLAPPVRSAAPAPSTFWDFTTAATLTDTQARAVLGAFSRAAGSPRSDSLTFDQAIINARKFLLDRASRAAIEAFDASPHARNADRAETAAAGALLYGRPRAALAAHLRAHELKPQNATHLANLAAILSYLGMPQEALVILDSPIVRTGRFAAPPGESKQTAILNARGYSLLQLGRPAEAEEFLRAAVALSAGNREVRLNLAAALWMQDDRAKKDEAAQLVAAVWRRTPASPGRTTTGDRVPPRETVTPGSEEIDTEIFVAGETQTSRLDLSRGKRLRIPDLKIPATLEASVAMHPKYQELHQKNAAVFHALGARQDQLHELIEKRLQKNLEKAQNSTDPMAALNSVSAVTGQQRTIEALNELIEFEKVKQHPSVRTYWEKARQAKLNDYQGVDFEQQWLVEEMPAGVADKGSQSRQLADKFSDWNRAEQAEKRADLARFHEIDSKYKKLRCTATREAHAKWRLAVHGFDTTQRNFLQAAYKHATAVIANIADPLEHELARIQIERDIYTAWNEHILITDSFYNRASAALKGDCLESLPKSSTEDIDEIKAEKAESCPDALKGNNKAKIDFEVIELSFNCEQMGVELSGGAWIALFAEVTVSFEGEITITAGVKADIELVGLPGSGIPADIGAKGGLFVKVGKGSDPTKGWQIKDVGISSEVSTSRGQGPIAIETSATSEYSFLPAVTAPTVRR